MKRSDMTAQTIKRCPSCHARRPDLVATYDCSRCGQSFVGTNIEGPPYRCPDDRIFLARSGDDACAECEDVVEGLEEAEVWWCSGCRDYFETEGEEHDCTPEEKAATKAQYEALRQAEMDEYRATMERDQKAVLHAVDALRTLGFVVDVTDLIIRDEHGEIIRRTLDEETWERHIANDYSADLSLSAASSSTQMSMSVLCRLASLIVQGQEDQ